LRSWLEDPDCNDQYSVIYEAGEKVAVFWNSVPEPTLVQERARWTETYMEWSPMGTYLATFHRMGVALWGGEKFLQLVRFEHFGVQFIQFSPNENYLITFSPPHGRHHHQHRGADEHPLIVWDVRTGQRKRSFLVEGAAPSWPIFKWSHDDRYFARVTNDVLSVYETPSFGLLDKKSFRLPGIKDFSWSPSGNIISYWVAEDREIPARVTLVAIPSRAELRVKNLFNVADCKMHWQKSGDYLCVKVDRYAKAKKDKDETKYSGLFYNFEVFHMKEKQIPVDSVEIKEPVLDFAWEPVGSKFAIIHGENPNISVSFYCVKKGQTTPVLLKRFDRKPCNRVIWSPQGQFCVLAGLKGMAGNMDFVDTGSADFTIMNSGEHFMSTDVEWDPTGRYVVTGVSWWAQKVDNAYWVWTFQGKVLQKHSKDKFCGLLWRPRPPTLLSAEQIREIKKKLKTYSVDFDVKDKMKQSKESKELLEKRSRLYRDFQEYRQKRREDWEKQRKRRLQMRGGVDTDSLETTKEGMEEETVEFLIKEEITVFDE
jgi:translation initiation factor 3 subunit B